MNCYDSKLESTYFMSISVGSETSEQSQSRVKRYLPKDMKPNKESFDSLGFSFKDIDSDFLYQALLPEGWSLNSDGSSWTSFIDEKGRNRGGYYYKSNSYVLCGYTSLSKRFEVTFKSINPENFKGPFTIFVKDTANEHILFSAGECEDLFSEEYKELMSKAKEFLETNYPEWKNPIKYWD